MQDDAKRPEGDHIEDAHEAEEQLHVHPGLRFDSNLEQGHIERVEQGRQQREQVSQDWVRD